MFIDLLLGIVIGCIVLGLCRIRIAQAKISAYITKRKERLDLRDAEIKSKVLPYLNCKYIVSGVPLFMRGIGGSYYNKVITINPNISRGIVLIDTLFHEDRHYQQDMQGKIDKTEYIDYSKENKRAYRQQHIEKDARRYAYVQTVRFMREHYPNKKFLLWVYRMIMNPFYGISHRIEG